MPVDRSDADASISAQNRAEVPAMHAQHRERAARLWDAELLILARPVTLWLAFHVDGLVTGAGATAAAACTSARHTELIAMSGDDSARHASSLEVFEAQLAVRVHRHRLVQFCLAIDHIEAFTKALDIPPNGRIHRLIKTAVRVAVGDFEVLEATV